MKISTDRCVACGNCTYVCPMGAIYIDPVIKRATINRDECVECYSCYNGMSQEHLNPTMVRSIRKVFQWMRVRFDPEPNDSALVEGVKIPRGTLLRSNLGKGERTACTFQTAHEVRLLPLRIIQARYFTRDIVELNLPPEAQCKAALRLRLEATLPAPFKTIAADPLSIFIRGADDFP